MTSGNNFLTKVHSTYALSQQQQQELLLSPLSPSGIIENDATIVREKVLAILEQHDRENVHRVDTLMQRFQGREMLLLDKITQRYRCDDASTSSMSPPDRSSKNFSRNGGGGAYPLGRPRQLAARYAPPPTRNYQQKNVVLEQFNLLVLEKASKRYDKIHPFGRQNYSGQDPQYQQKQKQQHQTPPNQGVDCNASWTPSTCWTVSSSTSSRIQQRNEMAVHRHLQRVRASHENKRKMQLPTFAR